MPPAKGKRALSEPALEGRARASSRTGTNNGVTTRSRSSASTDSATMDSVFRSQTSMAGKASGRQLRPVVDEDGENSKARVGHHVPAQDTNLNVEYSDRHSGGNIVNSGSIGININYNILVNAPNSTVNIPPEVRLTGDVVGRVLQNSIPGRTEETGARRSKGVAGGAEWLESIAASSGRQETNARAGIQGSSPWTTPKGGRAGDPSSRRDQSQAFESGQSRGALETYPAGQSQSLPPQTPRSFLQAAPHREPLAVQFPSPDSNSNVLANVRTPITSPITPTAGASSSERIRPFGQPMGSQGRTIYSNVVPRSAAATGGGSSRQPSPERRSGGGPGPSPLRQPPLTAPEPWELPNGPNFDDDISARSSSSSSASSTTSDVLAAVHIDDSRGQGQAATRANEAATRRSHRVSERSSTAAATSTGSHATRSRSRSVLQDLPPEYVEESAIATFGSGSIDSSGPSREHLEKVEEDSDEEEEDVGHHGRILRIRGGGDLGLAEDPDEDSDSDDKSPRGALRIRGGGDPGPQSDDEDSELDADDLDEQEDETKDGKNSHLHPPAAILGGTAVSGPSALPQSRADSQSSLPVLVETVPISQHEVPTNPDIIIGLGGATARPPSPSLSPTPRLHEIFDHTPRTQEELKNEQWNGLAPEIFNLPVDWDWSTPQDPSHSPARLSTSSSLIASSDPGPSTRVGTVIDGGPVLPSTDITYDTYEASVYAQAVATFMAVYPLILEKVEPCTTPFQDYDEAQLQLPILEDPATQSTADVGEQLQGEQEQAVDPVPIDVALLRNAISLGLPFSLEDDGSIRILEQGVDASSAGLEKAKRVEVGELGKENVFDRGSKRNRANARPNHASGSGILKATRRNPGGTQANGNAATSSSATSGKKRKRVHWDEGEKEQNDGDDLPLSGPRMTDGDGAKGRGKADKGKGKERTTTKRPTRQQGPRKKRAKKQRDQEEESLAAEKGVEAGRRPKRDGEGVEVRQGAQLGDLHFGGPSRLQAPVGGDSAIVPSAAVGSQTPLRITLPPRRSTPKAAATPSLPKPSPTPTHQYSLRSRSIQTRPVVKEGISSHRVIEDAAGMGPSSSSSSEVPHAPPINTGSTVASAGTGDTVPSGRTRSSTKRRRKTLPPPIAIAACPPAAPTLSASPLVSASATVHANPRFAITKRADGARTSSGGPPTSQSATPLRSPGPRRSFSSFET